MGHAGKKTGVSLQWVLRRLGCEVEGEALFWNHSSNWCNQTFTIYQQKLMSCLVTKHFCELAIHPLQHLPQMSLSSLSAFLDGIKAISKAWMTGLYPHVTAWNLSCMNPPEKDDWIVAYLSRKKGSIYQGYQWKNHAWSFSFGWGHAEPNFSARNSTISMVYKHELLRHHSSFHWHMAADP